MKRDPVRLFEDDFISLEVDQKKGEWPFLRVQQNEENGRIMFYIDCNEGGQIIGDGTGLAAISLSQKRARYVRDFLIALDLGGD